MAAETPTMRHLEPRERKSAEDFWLRLDNAAKIYPAIQSDEMTAVFRLSAVLRERVRISALLSAIQQLEERFPYYKMKPRKGFFWYYLQYYDEKITVTPDEGTPCRAFEKDQLFFRVLVKGKKVSVEFSHMLTDGAGGFEFLRSLLMTYFAVCGLPDLTNAPFMRAGENISTEEFEDAFAKYFQMDLPAPVKIPKSFHLPFRLKMTPRFEVMSFLLSLHDIMAKAKQLNVSLTVYLVGVYLLSLQNIYNRLPSMKKRRSRKIFRIQVPVNLRKMYPSGTMRNFSLYVTPEIDLRLGAYSFDEILKIVHHKMQLETDRKLISKIISRNVGAERNILLKNTPLFIKSLILFFTYKIQGTSLHAQRMTLPSQLFLLSPWLDLTLKNPEISQIDPLDPFLGIEGLKRAGESYAGGTDPGMYLLSPINGPLEGLPKTYLFVGTRDILAADARLLKKRMNEKHLPLHYREYDDMIHVWMFLNFPESRDARNEIIQLIKEGGH